jgi:uncharacterized protein (DUF1697 family)
MPTYISMLRGINLGGHKLVAMERLRALFESLGYKEVRTYINSGNVIFRGGKMSTSNLSRKLEKEIEGTFGFSVPVLTKTAEEIAQAVQCNPFVKDKAIDPTKLHVTFLWQAPAANDLKKLEALVGAHDRYCCLNSEVYLYCPNGYSETKLANNTIEKLLGSGATTRNWKTVNTLHEMSSQ